MAENRLVDEPPFRADHVGTFMRPPELFEARRQLNAGRLTLAELHGIEVEI